MGGPGAPGGLAGPGIRWHRGVGIHEDAARAEAVVNPNEEPPLLVHRGDVVECQRSGDGVCLPEGIVERRLAKACPGAETGKAFPCRREHVAIQVDQLDHGMRRREEDCLGEAPVPPPRSRTRSGSTRAISGGGNVEHRLIARDETPNGLVVGVNLNTEVAPN